MVQSFKYFDSENENSESELLVTFVLAFRRYGEIGRPRWPKIGESFSLEDVVPYRNFEKDSSDLSRSFRLSEAFLFASLFAEGMQRVILDLASPHMPWEFIRRRILPDLSVAFARHKYPQLRVQVKDADVWEYMLISALNGHLVRDIEVAKGWDVSDLSNGRWDEGDPVFSAQLLDLEAIPGSAYTRGQFLLKWSGEKLVLPIVLAGLTNAVVVPKSEELWREYQINRRLEDANGTCIVTGRIYTNLKPLVDNIEKALRQPSNSLSSICNVQAALLGLGYSPGPIDGQVGKDTKLAIQAFCDTWKLDKKAYPSPLFSSTLLRALKGEKPP